MMNGSISIQKNFTMVFSGLALELKMQKIFWKICGKLLKKRGYYKWHYMHFLEQNF